MLTACGELALGERAIEAGATLFLEKPLPLAELTAHLRHFAGAPASRVTYGEVIMPTDERDTILRLHRALQAHSKDLAAHAVAVRDVTVAIANEMHLPGEEIETIRIGALVCDIGMLAVPRKVRESAFGVADSLAQCRQCSRRCRCGDSRRRTAPAPARCGDDGALSSRTLRRYGISRGPCGIDDSAGGANYRRRRYVRRADFGASVIASNSRRRTPWLRSSV